MTNEQVIQKMKEDMKMRNFSKYTYWIGYNKLDKKVLTIQDLMNKIYDLECNLFEWTAEVNGNIVRVGRGGIYSIASGGDFYPASLRYLNLAPNHTQRNSTTRLSLYL